MVQLTIVISGGSSSDPTSCLGRVSAPDAPEGCGKGFARGRRLKPDITKEYDEKEDSKPMTDSGPCPMAELSLPAGPMTKQTRRSKDKQPPCNKPTT